MIRIPFSVYDFVGHLAAGVVLVAASTVAIGGVGALGRDSTVIELVVLVVVSYVAGHVIASFSNFILERRLTRTMLGSPTHVLFGAGRPNGWRRLFAAYLSPLPEQTIQRVLTKSGATVGVSEPGEALFYHCFGVVRQHEYPRERLATFLNLYGFTRNMSFTALTCAVILAAGALMSSDPSPTYLWVAAGCGVGVSAVLYMRFLKFYRLYSVEMYMWYAEID